jgi:hypothetical protein
MSRSKNWARKERIPSFWVHLKYFIMGSSKCIGVDHWMKWTWHIGLDELDVENRLGSKQIWLHTKRVSRTEIKILIVVLATFYHLSQWPP